MIGLHSLANWPGSFITTISKFTGPVLCQICMGCGLRTYAFEKPTYARKDEPGSRRCAIVKSIKQSARAHTHKAHTARFVAMFDRSRVGGRVRFTSPRRVTLRLG